MNTVTQKNLTKNLIIMLGLFISHAFLLGMVPQLAQAQFTETDTASKIEKLMIMVTQLKLQLAELQRREALVSAIPAAVDMSKTTLTSGTINAATNFKTISTIIPEKNDFIRTRVTQRSSEGLIKNRPSMVGGEGGSVSTGLLFNKAGVGFNNTAQGMGKDFSLGGPITGRVLVSEIPADPASINGVIVRDQSTFYSSRSETRFITAGKPQVEHRLKFSFFIDENSSITNGDNGWTLLQQVHENLTNLSPTLSLNLDPDGMLNFVSRTLQKTYISMYRTPAVKGKWHTVEYVFKTDERTKNPQGKVVIKFNGEQVVSRENITLSMCTRACEFTMKVGAYRKLTGSMGLMKVLYKDISVEVDTPVPYVSTDISSVIAMLKNPDANLSTDDYTQYTITRKDGTVHELRSYGKGVRPLLIGKLRETGYQGLIEEIEAMIVPSGFYQTKHVQSVTFKLFNRDKRITTDDYTSYYITLKDNVGGTQYELRSYGVGKQPIRVGKLRETGYLGNVAEITLLILD